MNRQALPIVLLFGLAPWGFQAQAQEPSPFGSGEQPLPSYAGEASPQNQLFTSLSGGIGYDDNILNTDTNRRSDTIISFSPRIALLRERRRLKFGVDYQPYYLLYRRTSERDLNHLLALDASYHVARHLELRLRDSFSYLTGIFEPPSSQQFMPALGPPTSLNQTVLTPLARTRQIDTRLDVLYQMSGRSSLDLFGAYLDRKFTRRAATSGRLYSSEGADAGLGYSYHLNLGTTLGVVYLLDNLSFGAQARLVTQSAFFSYARRLSPSVTFSVFGGPQLTRVRDSFVFEIPPFAPQPAIRDRVVGGQWQPAFGGSLVGQSRRTAFQISGQRLVADGGGLLRAATSSFVDVNLHRRLIGQWSAIGTIRYAQTSALGVGLIQSRIQYLEVGSGLERALTDKLTARLDYEYLRQRGGSRLPLQAEVDRNRVSFGFFYRVGSIPLGR